MAFIHDLVDALVRPIILSEVHSSFSQMNPLVHFLIGRDKAAMDAFGNPNAAAVFGGAMLTDVERMVLAGGQDMEIIYQTEEMDDVQTVERGGPTPTATKKADELYGTGRFRWTQKMLPVEIPQDTFDDVEDAPSALKINSAVALASRATVQKVLKFWDAELVNGTLTAAQQATRKWPTILGLRHTVSDGLTTGETAFTHYAGVDRTVHTQLAAKVNLAADLVSGGYIPDTIIKLNLFRQINTILAIGGLQQRGPGADLVITTPELWNVLAVEAEAKHTIFRNGIPGFAMSGFKRPVIQYDGMWITWANNIPSGEAYVLTLASWAFVVHKLHNFVMTDFRSQWKTEKGGDYVNWAQFDTKAFLKCSDVHLNVKCKDLTIS